MDMNAFKKPNEGTSRNRIYWKGRVRNLWSNAPFVPIVAVADAQWLSGKLSEPGVGISSDVGPREGQLRHEKLVSIGLNGVI
jgi:hypothetical protein